MGLVRLCRTNSVLHPRQDESAERDPQMERWARYIPRSVRRFLRSEDGVESVEWLALALLMASIILYFGRDLLTQIFDAFLVELEAANSD